jgi:urease alpha subunit
MGISKTECFTELAFIYGQTGPSTSVSFISTRSMVEVLMNGATRESSKGTGIVDSDKAKECIHLRTATREQAYGEQIKG